MMIVISKHGPECPRCHCDGFDDWWHDKTCKAGVLLVAITARLKCHGCGIFFAVTHYTNGETHSSIGL